MEHLARYRRTWRFFRRLLGPWLKRKFNYAPDLCAAKGPLLVLANHNTDWDPLLLALAFPDYLRFVASEHIFRAGAAAKLLQYFFDPIARLKGTTAGDAAMSVMRTLRQGVNAAIFAEGNRSFSGLTGEILPATGKLARASGATLVTYRFTGGYFTSPRWAGSGVRRGRMTGRVVNVYPPERLKAMTVDEVNEHIRADLAEDAYATQRREMIPFVSGNPAEGLETLLCLCPRCGAIGTLRSEGDTLFCGCGFSARYLPTGFLTGEGLPADNLTEWDAWQTLRLASLAPGPDGAWFSDTDMVLKEILPGHRDEELGSGAMSLYPDRLECCGQVFPLSEISGFSLHGAQTVDMSAGGRSYEISSPRRRCTRKYMQMLEHLQKL